MENEALKQQLQEAVDHYKKLDQPAFQEDVQALVVHLGEWPSIDAIEKALAIYKNKADMITKKDLPAIMAELGAEKVVLEDGTALALQRIYSTAIQNEPAFVAWCMEHGYGDVLKQTFTFQKGDEAVITAVTQFLAEQGASYASGLNKSGLPQTLGKIMREREEAGEELPPQDVLAVTIIERVNVK